MNHTRIKNVITTGTDKRNRLVVAKSYPMTGNMQKFLFITRFSDYLPGCRINFTGGDTGFNLFECRFLSGFNRFKYRDLFFCWCTCSQGTSPVAPKTIGNNS